MVGLIDVRSQAFRTRHIRGGDPYFDLFFRLAGGITLGTSLGLWAYFGNPGTVAFDYGGIGHPLFSGAVFGALLSFPACLFCWAYRKAKPDFRPRCLGRPALLITFLLCLIILNGVESIS